MKELSEEVVLLIERELDLTYIQPETERKDAGTKCSM